MGKILKIAPSEITLKADAEQTSTESVGLLLYEVSDNVGDYYRERIFFRSDESGEKFDVGRVATHTPISVQKGWETLLLFQFTFNKGIPKGKYALELDTEKDKIFSEPYKYEIKYAQTSASKARPS